MEPRSRPEDLPPSAGDAQAVPGLPPRTGRRRARPRRAPPGGAAPLPPAQRARGVRARHPRDPQLRARGIRRDPVVGMRPGSGGACEGSRRRGGAAAAAGVGMRTVGAESGGVGKGQAMTTDWGRARVARVSAGGTGPPRVEIGDIRQGSGTVFTFVEDWLLVSSRPHAGAPLTGPFGADAAEERHLRSALGLEVRDAPVHLDLTALKVISELLARRVNGRVNS